MRKKIILLTAILVAVFVLLQIPMKATAEQPEKTAAQMRMNDAVAVLRQAMVNRESPVTLQFWSDAPESEAMAQSLFYSALTHTGVPVEGDYLYRHIKGLNFHCESEDAPEGGYISTVTYDITYRTTAQQEALVDAKVEMILEELQVADKSDYEKILAVYQYLCDHISVDAFGAATGGTALSYTAYGALVEEVAVCQGFANAFYRLALELNVDNRLVAGKLGNVKHGWNIVAIDGFYYHVDATKDAGFRPDAYSYFLKCNLTDRIWDDAYTTEEFMAAYPMGEKDYDPHVHTWDDGTITKPATCVETGIMTYACTGEGCEDTYQEAIPLLTTHAWNDGEVTETATCGHTGEKLYTCTVTGCGKTYKETLPQWPEHSWDEGVVIQKPNGYREGIKIYTCTICPAEREESLPRIGWELTEGKWVYHRDGELATGWRFIGGVWYYFDACGVMKTGWLRQGGTWYYLKADGAMKTGWLRQGGTWYYLKADGAMKTGWLQIDGVWYYFKTDGAMKTGWLQLGDTWYYFHPSGAMATGTVKMGAVTYRFRPDGSWIN